MATELGGYEDNASAKNSALRKVTVSEIEDKAALDVNPLIKKQEGTISISSGSGNISLTGVDIRSNHLSVRGPSSSTTFIAIFTDTSSGNEVAYMRATSGTRGVAKQLSQGLPIFDVTISITEGSEDGEYTYLIMG